MVELINFLTKTEYLLSPRDSTAVKLTSFVNPSGRSGRNKPADMQQENNIKSVKNVVKGHGSGKTDRALVRASKAAPAINYVTDSFKTSVGLSASGPSKKYNKSDAEDKLVCSTIFRNCRPFKIQAKRSCGFAGTLVSIFYPHC
jgi:hypothetical protein